jgi:hypothetical protein
MAEPVVKQPRAPAVMREKLLRAAFEEIYRRGKASAGAA